MIRDLLAALDRGGSAVGVEDLARLLDTSPAAIEGALELLARKGRLVRAGPETGACDGCAARSMCNPLLGQSTRYIPVPPGARLMPPADGDRVGVCAATPPATMGGWRPTSPGPG